MLEFEIIEVGLGEQSDQGVAHRFAAQALVIFGGQDDGLFLTIHGQMLWSNLAGKTNQLAKASFGILQLPCAGAFGCFGRGCAHG